MKMQMSRNERKSAEVGMNELSDGNRIMESFESIGRSKSRSSAVKELLYLMLVCTVQYQRGDYRTYTAGGATM